MLLSSGSPQRAQSPFKKDYTDFWYQHGIQHLLQYRSSSKFVGKLPSSSHLRSLSSVEPCALPTCCVCLRRIREVSNLASGLNGASDLMVGRSYAGDAKLSLDELNTLSWHEDFKVVKDSKFAPEEENHLGVRCIVCHIYHAVATSRNNDVKSHRITEWQQQPSSNSNSTATTSMITSSSSGSSNSNGAHLGRCRTCNLSENIWVCLLCGHTGCGRYTSQHAKAHFQEYPSHHLSLELVSGRIWNYATDTFAYIEDESAHYISPVYSYSTQARLVASGQGVKAAADDGDDGECQGSVALTHQDYYRQGQASPSFTKKFILPSFLYPTSEDQNNSGSGRSGQLGRYPGHFATAGTGSELLSEESAASLGLDCVTTEKINALMGYYERLLEAQLLDQQLYFEKLLARETVRALESSYHSAEKEKETVSTAGNMAKKASSSKASLKVNEFNDAASASEEKTETTTTFLPESGMHINSPFLTRSNAFAEAQSELENEEVLRDMNEVETLKLEISGIEAEYQGILESMRAADDQVRLLKKENDVLIKSQKAKVRIFQ